MLQFSSYFSNEFYRKNRGARDVLVDDFGSDGCVVESMPLLHGPGGRRLMAIPVAVMSLVRK